MTRGRGRYQPANGLAHLITDSIRSRPNRRAQERRENGDTGTTSSSSSRNNNNNNNNNNNTGRRLRFTPFSTVEHEDEEETLQRPGET